MNNATRMRHYVGANYPDRDSAGADAIIAYAAGNIDGLLTPKQRRRIQHKRGEEGGHRQRQRVARQARDQRSEELWSSLRMLRRPTTTRDVESAPASLIDTNRILKNFQRRYGGSR